MQSIMSLEHAERVLARYERPIATEAYNLDTMRHLVEALGNPQNDIAVIHIAGTSGKTSTAYYCAALLKEAGYNVGLSVSPHIDSITERTQINLQGLDERSYCNYLGEFIELVEKTGLEPSYFELLVAFSYWVFARKECVDVAVMEVGLGGLLDATNIVNRADKICVITDIGYDHMAVLGSTIEEIAAQKAGIIQKENQVFMHQQETAVMQVIHGVADRNHANVSVVDDATYAELPLFQQRNFSLARAAVDAFCRRDDRTLTKENEQLARQVTVPARMEAVTIQGKTVIFDGSHNDQKIGALVDSLREKYPGQAMTFVVAFGNQRRQNAVEGLRLLHVLSDSVVVTQFENRQDSRQHSLSAEDLADIASDAGFATVIQKAEPKGALEYALTTASMVVVTGSFYLLRYLR